MSWPAKSSVITSSRICVSLRRLPSSSSASSSRLRMSLPRRPEDLPVCDLRVDQDIELSRRRPASAPTASACRGTRGAGSRWRRRRAPPRTARRRRSRAPGRCRGPGRTARASRRASRGGASSRTDRAVPGDEPLDGMLGLLTDRLDGGGDVLAVEGGEHDAPGAAVEVAVDRQQPIAHQPDQVAEAPFAPLEVGCVRDEDVVVRRRTEHEDDVAVQQPQREDRPEALVALEQHLERFLREAARARKREAGLARRVGHPRAALVAQVLEKDPHRASIQHRRRSDERHA